MALSVDELARLRRMINEATEDDGWTDEILLTAAEAFFVNNAYDLRGLSASLWEEKAARVAELANISESGSSRSLSQIFDHYMEMAKRFGTPVTPGGEDATVYPRSTRIVRPVREG